MKIQEQAPAKINLALNILGRRTDGYHELRMVMQSVSLCDTVTVEETGIGFALLADGFTVPAGKSSLEQQAAEAFFAAVGRPMPPLTVHLEKTTPAYAGLGGGSADVAALLRCRGAAVFEENLFSSRYRHVDELARMGADIRVSGRTAVVLGVGRAIGEAMAIIMVAGNVANMPGLFQSVRFLTTGIISGMSYAPVGSLYQQALFSIGLVLFLFIMLINVFLNVFIKRKKED